MSETYFHGSPNENAFEIKNEGLFGGIFGTSCEGVADGHGRYVYQVESPNPFPCDVAEVEGFWDACMEVSDGNETIADAIFYDSKIDESDRDALCEITDVEDYDISGEWALQKLRGQAAAKLGYTSIESDDEHGTSYLCLPGCIVRAKA